MDEILDRKPGLFKSRFWFDRREYSICGGVRALVPGTLCRPSRSRHVSHMCTHARVTSRRHTPRLRGIRAPRLLGSIAGVSGILDHPLSRLMTNRRVGKVKRARHFFVYMRWWARREVRLCPPYELAMTCSHNSAISPRHAPEVCQKTLPSKVRAQGIPGA